MTVTPIAAAGAYPLAHEDLLDIVIVDGQPVVREGLRVLLRSEGVRVVDTATSVTQATSVVARHRPGAALVGVGADLEGALDTARAISGGATPSYVLLYADGDCGLDLFEALERGAAGVVTRRTPIAKIADALRAVATGQVWFESELSRPPALQAARAGRLSRRELDVIAEMAMGRGTDAIAATLGVSAHTVRTHVRNVLKKLGARTRAHAVAIAMHEGAVDVNP